jgi:soluble lytic murein transglycosylase
MTAESALQPEVTSLAGARGLMQLMPVEAETIHRELFGVRPYDADNLYAAPYNAAMGTAELGLKTRSLGDVLAVTSIPAVVASYNGGEEAVRRWLEGGGDKPDFDEFAEDVGYTETRQYIRRVLGFVMAYRWVYGDAAP